MLAGHSLCPPQARRIVKSTVSLVPRNVAVMVEPSVEQRIVTMAIEAFKTTGNDFTLLVGDGAHYGVSLDGIGLELWMDNLISETVAERQAARRRRIHPDRDRLWPDMS